MRFLLTADWQLGLIQRQLGEHSAMLSEARFDAVRRIVELAVDRQVDALIVAGDIFEDSDVDSNTVERCIAILEDVAPVPVLLLPGNHDPRVAGGIWDREVWSRTSAHVRLLLEAREIDLGGVAIYPCPIGQKQSRKDPTAWIPPRSPGDSRIRVGVAHGSLGILERQANFPIAGDRVQQAGLDFLALGDWHGMTLGDRWAYPGTPEQTRFSERDAGHVLIVELESAGSLPQVEAVGVGLYRWCAIQLELREDSDREELETRIGECGSDLSRVLLRLSGEIEATAGLGEELDRLRRRLEAEACLLDWRFEETSAAIPEWPPGMIEAMAGALDDAEAGRELSPPFSAVVVPDAASAVRARRLLARLVRGAAG